MASEFVVTRSFYSWLCNTSLQESKLKGIIPPVLPTKISPALAIAKKAEGLLEDSPFKERAIYWKDLLSSFKEQEDEKTQ